MIHIDAFSKMGKFFKIVWPVMYGPGDTCGSNLLQVLIIYYWFLSLLQGMDP